MDQHFACSFFPYSGWGGYPSEYLSTNDTIIAYQCTGVMASRSAMLICWTVSVGRSQHTSSSTALLLSNTTLIAKELASIHAFTSLVMHQIPQVGSSWHNLIYFSTISCLRGTSFTVSFHLFVTMLVCLFIVPVTAWSHL